MARQQLTDEGLAELSGVSRPVIAALRKGTTNGLRLQTLQRVADALNISLQISIEPKPALDAHTNTVALEIASAN